MSSSKTPERDKMTNEQQVKEAAERQRRCRNGENGYFVYAPEDFGKTWDAEKEAKYRRDVNEDCMTLVNAYLAERDEQKPPKRRCDLTIDLHADEMDILLRDLDAIVSNIKNGCTASVGGGYTSGEAWELTVDESITHDSYEEALEKYLNK
jgi:hypothetical protein